MTIPELFRKETPREAARRQYEEAARHHFEMEDYWRQDGQRELAAERHKAGVVAGHAAFLEDRDTEEPR